MLRIRCPHCGTRDETEFAFGGEALVHRPGPEVNDADWADYLFNRENSKGVQHEYWVHSFGCGQWFTVKRDTVSHDILAAPGVGEPPSGQER